VARLGRARGLRGELNARASRDAGFYQSLGAVYLRRRDGAFAGDGRAYEVESVKPFKDGLIYRFRGIDNRTDAEGIEHCEVLIPEKERPPLTEGEYYLSELIGCQVFDLGTGQEIGKVVRWQEFGGPELLEVEDSRGGLILIPLAKEICVEIDLANRRIVVDPPAGLIELNRA